MDANSTQYHIALSKSMVEDAEYVILPGDPGRVASIAQAFDPEARLLASNREYTSFLAAFCGHKILVCSTGIGGPSISIALEELANIGLTHFLRVGTCGALQPHIKIGDLIISRASVRLDGASTHYAPIEYPAAASMLFTMDAVQAAAEHKVPYHLGITASSDTFYPGQERYDNFTHYVPNRFQGSAEEWRKLNVANFEMESATLFTIINVFGLDAACLCGVIVNRNSSEHPVAGAKEIAAHNWSKVTVETIRRSLQRRGLLA